MIIELHMLQNFPPSCLNRDDTNSPKECEFGGYRRARISSQCIKRAIRWDSAFQKLMESNGGVRTKQLITEVVKRLQDKSLKGDKVSKLISDVFDEAGISSGEKDERTDIVFFIDNNSIDKLVSLFNTNLDSLKKGDKNTKDKIIKELGNILAQSVKVPDIALFGRMLAIKPDKPLGKMYLNVDAASQVAHAISTNRINTEFDFYTAVDDLQPKETTGAGMMGTIEFNSACYYRYANIDLEQLKENLDGDEELAVKTVEAFLKAAVHAIPTGKQTSMAAQNPPSLVFAVVRDSGMWNLANAFAKPVPSNSGDLVQNSIKFLVNYWNKLASVYGSDGIQAKPALALDNEVNLDGLDRVETLEQLIVIAKQKISFAG